MASHRVSWAASVHEAAHAVARLHVGAPATDTEVLAGGAGMTHGTGGQWLCRSTGQYALWDLLTVLLAGGLAEAKVSKRAACLVFMSNAVDDYAQAREVIGTLVASGFAKSEADAYLRAEAETKAMLRERWEDVRRLAALLRSSGLAKAGSISLAREA